jgi:hypothetical protein
MILSSDTLTESELYDYGIYRVRQAIALAMGLQDIIDPFVRRHSADLLSVPALADKVIHDRFEEGVYRCLLTIDVLHDGVVRVGDLFRSGGDRAAIDLRADDLDDH